MSHQFLEHYFSLSERLSHILDNSGYSLEDRNRKVMVANEIEVFYNIAHAFQNNFRRYVFGSRGEGSTGPDLQSDVDYLFQCNTIKVVTDISQCNPEEHNLLMVQDNNTHPGYVKLQRIIISPDFIPAPVYLDIDNNNIHAVDSLYRAVITNKIFHAQGTVSGPAVHDHHILNELSSDTVPAFRCTEWPQEGNEWLMRRRLNGWPTPMQIDTARKYGCFVTPVGHPHSSEFQLEWRISFSIAERDLTRSFEDTTMKVYILLKMLRKTYIEPFVGDAFSSYHCKVCMFWMRERIPQDQWCNKNLLQCLILCIRQLYEWAIAGFCPDYFIRINNIYDRKIIGAIRHTLVQILGDLLSSNCTFLHGIQCCNLGHHMSNQMSRFDHCIHPMMNTLVQILGDLLSSNYTFLHGIQCCNLGHHMSNQMSRFDRCIDPMMREEIINHILTLTAAGECRHSILQYIPQDYSSLVDYLDKLMCVLQNLQYITEYPLKDAMMIILSQLGFHIATICNENAHILSREKVDYLVALASSCLSFGINIDATSVRLKLCGFGMEIGNHNLIETSLQHISDYHMKYVYSRTINSRVILECNFESCYEKLLRNKYNIEELLQTQISFSVVYLPTEMSITPKPLRMEMFRSIGAPSDKREEKVDLWYDWGVVDSLICLYFFQYQNFSRQRKERHKQVAMYNMIHVIRTEPNIHHRDTAFNLLGYSFIQENQLTNAFICFMQSLSIRPYHNSAKLYLGIIFNMISANGIRHTHHVNCDMSSYYCTT
ncbi:hypothetical protein ACJMK2_018733 [Sinanodonta woodiana]|uniref:Mab-21-like HhH/H2TH-like domain-containing protein n=1 Tax=Sinanodonta woodiana TaxID=1069815 RepID=A0ABD3UFT3_SINWO